MKKMLSLVLATLCVFTLSACGEPENEERTPAAVIEETIDSNGNLLIEPVYMDWNLWYYNEYTYNDANKVTNKKFCHYNGDVINEWKYIYRTDGTLEKVEDYYEISEVMLGSEELYDESGQLYKKQDYDTKGDVVDYRTYENDSEGNCTKETWFTLSNVSTDFELEKYILYTYDDKGNCVKAETFDDYDSKQEYTVYEYDANGNVISQQYYWQNDTEALSVTEYAYHENGKVHKTTVKSANGDIYWEEIKDSKGAVVSLRSYDRTSLVLNRTEEYSGNRKTYGHYAESGEYWTETYEGNAERFSLIEMCYYNADGSLYCTFRDAVYYDDQGTEIQTPDLSAWVTNG